MPPVLSYAITTMIAGMVLAVIYVVAPILFVLAILVAGVGAVVFVIVQITKYAERRLGRAQDQDRMAE